MSNTGESRIDDWKKALRPLAAFGDWMEAEALPEGHLPSSDWEPFLQELRPLLAGLESVSTGEELDMVIDRLRRVIEKHELASIFWTWLVKVCPELRPAVEVLFPPQLGPIGPLPVPDVRLLLGGIEHIELGDIEERAGRFFGAHVAAEEEPELELPPRYANAVLVHETADILNPRTPIAPGKVFRLRLDIGGLSPESAVTEHVHLFPEGLYWLRARCRSNWNGGPGQPTPGDGSGGKVL